MREIKEIEFGNEVFEIVDEKGRQTLQETKTLLQGEIDATNDNVTNLAGRLTTAEGDIDSLETAISKLPFKKGLEGRYLTVGKNGSGMYSTINEAFDVAKGMSRSAVNRVTIFILPGLYHEKIAGNNFNYIDFVGIDRDSCIIEYPSVYPNCVIHVHGNNVFRNLTIRSTSNASYCVHADLLNVTTGYELVFDNCYMYGGSNAIGHGSSQNSTLIVKNCVLKGSQSPLYFHNSPYSNTTGQYLILENNTLYPVDGYCVLADDAATGYGATNSYLFVTANGNITPALTANVLFRPHPGMDQYNRKYIGDDYQIKITTSSAGNFNEALDYGGGEYDLTTYVVLPASPDPNGYYRTGIQTGTINATKYNRDLLNVTNPGVGDVTGSFGLGAVTAHSIELSTLNASLAGKTVSVSIKLGIG